MQVLLLLATAVLLMGVGFYVGWNSITLIGVWPPVQQHIVDNFHYLYYYNDTRTWNNTRWLGVPAQKLPLDLWVYQEILWELRPDFLIETGTFKGGSALYFASLFDLIGKGKVITIDIEHPEGLPVHDRIEYLLGSSTSPEIISEVKSRIDGAATVMVVLDSDHSAAHVANEIQLYSPLVTVGSYLIVEDTNLSGHPVVPSMQAGPMEALEPFLAGTADFVSDRDREKYFLSQNPRGYVRRIR